MTDIYVATTGNDSTGNGTAGNPYATPGKAGSVFSAGDRIFLTGGSYTIGSGSANTAGNRVALSTSNSNGNSAGYIYGGNVPGDGIQATLTAGASTTAVDLLATSGNFYHIEGVVCDGNNKSGVNGISMTGLVYFVYNCYAKNCPGIGFVNGGGQGTIHYSMADNCALGFGIGLNGGGRLAYCVTKNCTTGFDGTIGRGFWAADPQVTDTWLQTFVALGGGTISMDDARAAVSTSVPRFVALGIAMPGEVEAITDEHLAAAERVAMVRQRMDEMTAFYSFALNEVLGPMVAAAETGEVTVPSFAELVMQWEGS